MVISNFDKQALKENSYTVLSRITIVGTDTVFTEEDAIVDWNYEDYRYVPGTGFIGQFVERILDGNLQNISEDVILEDKEINLQIGIVNGLNEQTTWYDYGNFLITNVSETDTTGNFKFESCDYTKKFNTIYEDNISYPTISLALANDVCSQANVELQPDGYCHFYVIPKDGLTAGNYNFYYNGTYYNFSLSNDLAFYDTLMYVENTETLTLKTVDNSFNVTRTDLEVTVDSSATGTTLVFTRTPYVDFTNNDFVVENNQYESEDTLRKVMQDIGKLAYSWVRVAEDNKVYIDFEQKSEESVDTFDELSTDEYYTSKKSDLYFGPVNKVLIGMKDVEGENLYKTSDDYTEETECSLKIFDNDLTYTDELRAIALNGCEKLFGLKYMPLQIETIGHPWLEGNELIKLTNVDEEELYTYPFNRQIKYAGYIEGVIGAEAQTSQETEYEYTKDIISDVKKTRFIVDKDNQRIDSLIERTEGSESRITELEQTTEGITATVEHLNDEYEQNVVIKKTADGNPIEVEDAGHYQLNDFKIYGNTEQDGTPTPTNPVDVQTITSKGNTTHFEGDNFEVQNDYDESLELVERSNMEFSGNTSQVQYTGKNLLKYPYSDTTKTTNGITFTDNGDGSITINGTSTGQAIFYLKNNGWSFDSSSILPTGTYTFNKLATNNNVFFYINIYKNDGTNQTYYTSSGNKTFNITETQSLNMPRIVVASGITLNNVKVYPQLELGSTATSFEPYVGGTASPNPSYPQPVNVVSGDNTIKVEGKNLWGFLQKNFISNNSTTSTIINVDTLEVTSANNSYANTRYKVDLPNGTYTFKLGKVTNTNSDMTTKRMSLTQFINGVRSVIQHIDEGNSYTFTIANEENKMYTLEFWASYATALINTATFEGIQIEKGSTATTYEPYQKQNYSVNLGSMELCKIGTYQDYIYKDNGSWYLHKEIGKVVLNGSETGWAKSGASSTDVFVGALNLTNYGISLYTKSNSGNLWLVNNFKNGTLGQVNVFTPYNPNTTYGYQNIAFGISSSLASDINGFKTWLGNNKANVYYIMQTPTTTEITNDNYPELLEQLESVNDLEFFDGLNNYTTTSSNLPIQNKFDITNTNYEVVTISDNNNNTLTHRILMKDFELCEIGDYRDYLYFDSGKWYKHKEIGKVVLNGSENWYLAERSGTSNGVFFLQNYLTTYGVMANTSYSNYATYTPNYVSRVGLFDIHYGQIRFYAYSSTATVQEWKDKIASNNLIVYSILATPTNEEITDTTITNTLNEILQSYLYKGYNRIYLHDEIADKIEITYLTDSILNSTYAAKTQLALTEESLSATVERTTALENNVTSLQLGVNNISTEVTSVKDITSDLENSINYLNIELSGNSIIIPTNDENLPYISTTYTIPYTATFKGDTVTPTVTTADTATGITVSFATGQIKVGVSTTTAITSLTNTFNINFTYTNEGQTYLVTKAINVGLSVKGEDGKDGTSVTILGSYDTLAQLQAAHPTGNAGDSYMVGDDLYVWSVTTSAWVDVGQIKGNDGTSSYVYIRYSENETGNPMTTSPTSTSKYIGLASTNSATAPTSYTSYTWSQYAGTDGETTYVHVKYSEDGSTFVEATDDAEEGDTPSAWIGVLTDTNEEASTNFEDYTWYKFTEDIDEQLTDLQNSVSENKTNIENNYTAIVEQLDDYAKADVVATLKQTVETNQSDTAYAISVVKDLQVNGVSQVRTEKGFTFNDDGLTIDETNSVTKGIYDTNGVSIIDKTGSSNSETFFAGYDEETHTSIVRTNNLSVSTYFNIGTKSRFEDYEDGTGVFI